MNYQDILAFWFAPETRPNWFAKSAEFDAIIRKNFAGLLDSAAQAELWGWRACAEGRLAEIIVLDQFSRNLHRASAAAFAQGALALALAQEPRPMPPTKKPGNRTWSPVLLSTLPCRPSTLPNNLKPSIRSI